MRFYMKFSKQRQQILETVITNPIHPTANQVYNAVRKITPNISMGTVYRNLNHLSEQGLLLKIGVANGCDRFDGRTDKHFHMICNECEKVYDIELEELKNLADRVHKESNFIVTGFDLTIEGICKNCCK